MNYQQTLQYLYDRLPMFQRVGASAFKKDLTNTLSLAEAVGNPHQNLRFIHIAGTNGKGTVSHLLASVFQSAGIRTGLYTSPHLKDFRERMKVNGMLIPEEEIVSFVANYQPDIERISPSFFEATVVMALDYFKRAGVETVILETGMGGRLDSTNIVTPDLSIITNISFDHIQFLGNTLPKIAYEKAGIMKPNTPCIIGEYHAETAPVFKRTAQELHAPYFFSDELEMINLPMDLLEGIEIQFRMKEKNYTVKTPLSGPYQWLNVRTAFRSALFAFENGWIPYEAIAKGFQDIYKNTGLRGRWEWIQQNPKVLLDTAHNEAGLRIVFQSLRALSYRKLHIVTGSLNDKDLSKILPLFPKEAVYYFARPDIPRGLDAVLLQKEAAEFGLYGETYSSVNSAYSKALSSAETDDLIFVGGSMFVVAELI